MNFSVLAKDDKQLRRSGYEEQKHCSTASQNSLKKSRTDTTYSNSIACSRTTLQLVFFVPGQMKLHVRSPLY